MGKPKNRTTSTSKDGSYLEKKWIQDYEAFFGALLNAAGVNPNGTVDTAVASQFFDALQSILLGVNQTWQDVTSSRTSGTTYTNNTGKPIQVSCCVINGTDYFTLTVDGVAAAVGNNEINLGSQVTAIVPNGSDYSVDLTSPSTIYSWSELR